MNKRDVNPAKAARVEALKQHLSQAKSVAIVDYTGLKVGQATQLRRDIKAAGGEMKVEKNTLFRIALGPLSNQLTNNQLTGLSAFIFSKTDEVAALKPLAEFIKKTGVGKWKTGLLGDRLLTASEIEALAKIPGREILLSQLVGLLNSPAFKLVYSLNFNLAKLVRVLQAISDKGVN